MANEQLCWTCRRACGRCAWSHAGKPVEGWTARPATIRANVTGAAPIPTYSITACPQYLKDAPRNLYPVYAYVVYARDTGARMACGTAAQCAEQTGLRAEYIRCLSRRAPGKEGGKYRATRSELRR